LVLDGEGAVRLTAEEHAELVEHTRTTDTTELDKEIEALTE
jgi:hypothetical protein